MSTMIPVEEAQTKLKELIDKLVPGEEVILTENHLPVAKLVGERPPRPLRPAPGLGKGSILYMAPDFDEPMEEFREYMDPRGSVDSPSAIATIPSLPILTYFAHHSEDGE